MLTNLNRRINYICHKLEFVSISEQERASLLEELSKLKKDREEFRKVMREYGWMKESSEPTKKQ